jgi:hypothetical protein
MIKFAQHIFISYAHIDNQPLSPEQKGWITRFHKTLEGLLNMRLGRSAAIWRDNKLSGNDIFAEEITRQFKDVALLISILTPRYINSEWCTREAHLFCQEAEKNGGLTVENRSRVLKVIKTPINNHASLPNAFESITGYDFYTLEEGIPLELDPEYGEKFKQDYNRKVAILAYDAAKLISTLEAEEANQEQGASGSEPEKTKVYLAECSVDRRENREKLIADLKLNGYAVVPDQPLPLDDETAYRSAATSFLEAASLSIHLVGSTPGATPDGPSQKSIGLLQNELAAEISRQGTLKRVIWLPENTSSSNQQHQSFIEALHQDAEVQAGATLITGTLEELKSTIYRDLKRIEQAACKETEATEPPADETQKMVYLVCVEQDRKLTVPLRKWLKAQGLETKLPLFAGEATAVREVNEQLLATCDAVLLFYGAGDEAWKTAIDSDHRKIRAYRGAKPLLARVTYLAEPLTDDKQDLIDMEEAALIDGLAGFDADAMAGFLQTLGGQGVTG